MVLEDDGQMDALHSGRTRVDAHVVNEPAVGIREEIGVCANAKAGSAVGESRGSSGMTQPWGGRHSVVPPMGRIGTDL